MGDVDLITQLRTDGLVTSSGENLRSVGGGRSGVAAAGLQRCTYAYRASEALTEMQD